MEFHNNISALVKAFTKSHEQIIRSVCEDLNVKDETIINDLIKKHLDTSFSSVKPKKDPNRCKKPKNSYMYFCDENRKRLQTENPGMKMGDVSKLLGNLWKNTSEEDKSKFNDMHEEDVERYENEK